MNAKDIALIVEKYASEIDWHSYDYIHASSWNMENAINYSLIRHFQPKSIFEVGPQHGYTTKFLADAARTYGQKVVSIERADDNFQIATEKLKGLNIELVHIDAENYNFPETIDFFFYDGDHIAKSVDWYKNLIYPRVHGWFVVHDIDMSSNETGEAREFKKVFDGKYITTKQIMAETNFRPPYDNIGMNEWANSMVFIQKE